MILLDTWYTTSVLCCTFTTTSPVINTPAFLQSCGVNKNVIGFCAPMAGHPSCLITVLYHCFQLHLGAVLTQLLVRAVLTHFTSNSTSCVGSSFEAARLHPGRGGHLQLESKFTAKPLGLSLQTLFRYLACSILSGACRGTSRRGVDRGGTVGEDSGQAHTGGDGVPQLQVRLPEQNVHLPIWCRHSIDPMRRDCLLWSG